MYNTSDDDDDNDGVDSNSSASLHTIADLDAVDINAYEDRSTITPLMQAARAGDIEGVQNALRRRYHVNSVNNRGLTALHLAVLARQEEIVKLLLGHEEINIDAQDWTGMTSLMHACQKRAPVNIIQALLEAGCNPSLTDHECLSALWHALIGHGEKFKDFNPTVLKLLIEHGVDINARRSDMFKSPISYVLTSRRSCPADRAEAAGALLFYGADPSLYLESFIDIRDETLYDMVLPYFSTCDTDTFIRSSLPTVTALWKVQSRYNKQQIAELIECTDIRLVDVLCYTLLWHPYAESRDTKPLDQIYAPLISFVYQLFDCEEMVNVMYSENLAQQIHRLFEHLDYNIADDIAADILRISLSNYNYMDRDVFSNVLSKVKNPRETIKVLEDFNVSIVLNSRAPAWTSFLTSMYTHRPSALKEIPSEYHDRELRGFYNFTGVPSLVELSRNAFREMSKFHMETSRRPFQYAARIKSLPCPKHIKNILLYRTRTYDIQADSDDYEEEVTM